MKLRERRLIIYARMGTTPWYVLRGGHMIFRFTGKALAVAKRKIANLKGLI